MRAVLKFGYQELLLAPTANVGDFVNALEGAMFVEEAGPYGHRVYKPKEDEPMTLTLLPDNSSKLPGVIDAASLEFAAAAEKQREEASSARYSSEAKERATAKKLAEVEAKFEALLAACPHGATEGDTKGEEDKEEE